MKELSSSSANERPNDQNLDEEYYNQRAIEHMLVEEIVLNYVKVWIFVKSVRGVVGFSVQITEFG
jgi:hypothetical protein